MKVMNLPGTLGTALDSTNLDYPNVRRSDLSEDESKIFAAIPAFLEGANVSINFPYQCTFANFTYIFRKCRMCDELSPQASVRTMRDTEFGEIVHPFTYNGWDSSYYGPPALTKEFKESYSSWLENARGPGTCVPGNNPVAHMPTPDPSKYFTPPKQRGVDGDESIFFKKEYDKIERNPSKQDMNCERLLLDEAYKELFGKHRIVNGERDERQAQQVYTLSLPFQLVLSLMEYSPNSAYWEPLGQLKTFEYWMRTPLLPRSAKQAAVHQEQRGKLSQKCCERSTKWYLHRRRVCRP
jgi:hypothetical protein